MSAALDTDWDTELGTILCEEECAACEKQATVVLGLAHCTWFPDCENRPVLLCQEHRDHLWRVAEDRIRTRISGPCHICQTLISSPEHYITYERSL